VFSPYLLFFPRPPCVYSLPQRPRLPAFLCSFSSPLPCALPLEAFHLPPSPGCQIRCDVVETSLSTLPSSPGRLASQHLRDRAVLQRPYNYPPFKDSFPTLTTALVPRPARNPFHPRYSSTDNCLRCALRFLHNPLVVSHLESSLDVKSLRFSSLEPYLFFFFFSRSCPIGVSLRRHPFPNGSCPGFRAVPHSTRPSYRSSPPLFLLSCSTAGLVPFCVFTCG